MCVNLCLSCHKTLTLPTILEIWIQNFITIEEFYGKLGGFTIDVEQKPFVPDRIATCICRQFYKNKTMVFVHIFSYQQMEINSSRKAFSVLAVLVIITFHCFASHSLFVARYDCIRIGFICTTRGISSMQKIVPQNEKIKGCIRLTLLHRKDQPQSINGLPSSLPSEIHSKSAWKNQGSKSTHNFDIAFQTYIKHSRNVYTITPSNEINGRISTTLYTYIPIDSTKNENRFNVLASSTLIHCKMRSISNQ